MEKLIRAAAVIWEGSRKHATENMLTGRSGKKQLKNSSKNSALEISTWMCDLAVSAFPSTSLPAQQGDTEGKAPEKGSDDWWR